MLVVCVVFLEGRAGKVGVYLHFLVEVWIRSPGILRERLFPPYNQPSHKQEDLMSYDRMHTHFLLSFADSKGWTII